MPKRVSIRGGVRHEAALVGSARPAALAAPALPSSLTELYARLEQQRPILILSGCYYLAGGAAQRPSALARELAATGELVIYYNTDPRNTTALEQGVYCVGPQYWEGLVVRLLERPGVAIATFPTYAPALFDLHRAGWRLIYDLLDDWQGFYESGDLHWNKDQFLSWQRDLICNSDFVTCSANSLIPIAQANGRLDPVLIRNGGPAAAFERIPREKNGKIRVVYCGYMLGHWFDWNIISLLDKQEDFEIFAIGDYSDDQHPRRVSHYERTTFTGPLPYDEAMRYMASADVSIIPFKHSLSEKVDPIKLYDAYAAGVWSVATPIMTELWDRPFVTLAEAPDFPEAIRAAARRRKRPDAAIVTENSWAARGQQMLALVRETGSRPALPTPEPRLVTEAFKLRITWAGPSTCNAFPTCKYCCTRDDRSMRAGDLPASPVEMATALLNFTETEGPCLFSVCWGEPLVDDDMAWILGLLSNCNRVDAVTNLVFPLRRLDKITNPGNVAFCTSFHPQLWDWSTEGFIAKRRAVEERGIHCGVTEVVAYPDWFDKLPGWFEELRAAEVPVSVLPYRGWHRGTGKMFPASYTEEQWAFLKDNLIVYHQDLRDSVYDGSAPPTGRICSVGRDYVFIDWSGQILRCVMPQKSEPNCLGNIFTGWKLLDAPAPCSATACPCADLWQFIEG